MKKFYVRILLCIIFIGCDQGLGSVLEQVWGLNTSNEAKKKDFEDLFFRYGNTHIQQFFDLDLPEIDSDPISVVAHKASQLPDGVIVEDSSFDVEGADVGINVRWLIDHLINYVGHRASLTTLVAVKKEDQVYVFQGRVDGQIVEPRGPVLKGFYINPYFLPDGRDKTLAEHADDKINPRAIAVKNLINNHIFAVSKTITDWQGNWQKG